MKHIIMVLLVFCVAACTGKDGSFDLRKPYHMDLTPPEGPPEYEQGWSDGCETGSNAYAGSFYKSIGAFDLKMDVELRKNKMYYQAWKDAYIYCAIYWESTNRNKI